MQINTRGGRSTYGTVGEGRSIEYGWSIDVATPEGDYAEAQFIVTGTVHRDTLAGPFGGRRWSVSRHTGWSGFAGAPMFEHVGMFATLAEARSILERRAELRIVIV